MTYTFDSITDVKEFYPYARYLLRKSTLVIWAIFAGFATIMFLMNMNTTPWVANLSQALIIYALMLAGYELLTRSTIKRNFKASGLDRFPSKMAVGAHALTASNKQGRTTLTPDKLFGVDIRGDAVYFMVDKRQGLILTRKHMVKGDWDSFLKMVETSWQQA